LETDILASGLQDLVFVRENSLKFLRTRNFTLEADFLSNWTSKSAKNGLKLLRKSNFSLEKKNLGD